MAEKHQANDDSANRKPILVSTCLSSNETSPSGPTELQPYTLGRVSSPSHQSSIMVPVRLDVLLFLLNSAARGAQYALPPVSVQGGQGPPSTCHHGPAVQHVPNCCGCPSTCNSVSQPCGPHQHGGNYGGVAGTAESRDNRYGRDVNSPRSDGKSWPAAGSTGGWKIPQSPMGWQENPRGEGRGRDNGDNWRGRRQNFGGSWRDRRPSSSDSSWRSSSPGWRKEGSAFGSNYTNNKRSQEERLRPLWDAPDAKRPTDNARASWPKVQGTKDSTSFLDKPADGGPSKPAVQESGEDWETDYESGQTSSAAPGTVPCSSHSDVPPSLPKEEDRASSTDDPSKLRPSISPAPESASKTQDPSKNGGFVSYLKSLYSDLPKKSSSDGSSDLVIDTDAESSKPDEEEPSPQNEAGGESKSWE